MQPAKIEMRGFNFIIYDMCSLYIWVSILVLPLFFLKSRALLFHVQMADSVTLRILWKGRGNADLKGMKVCRLSSYKSLRREKGE
jgi:hypothetical protein